MESVFMVYTYKEAYSIEAFRHPPLLKSNTAKLHAILFLSIGVLPLF